MEENNNRYTISQISYIENILSKCKISNIRKTKTTCTGDSITENKTPFNKTTFKSALESLIYVAKCTRPDIAFALIIKLQEVPKTLLY